MNLTKKENESSSLKSGSLSSTYPSRMPKQQHPQAVSPPPDVEDYDRPSSNAPSYNEDQSMLKNVPEQETEQPNAFSKESKTSIFYQPSQENSKRYFLIRSTANARDYEGGT